MENGGLSVCVCVGGISKKRQTKTNNQDKREQCRHLNKQIEEQINNII